MFRRMLSALIAFSFVAALAACGDTWHGAKEDTGENLHATGHALEKAGNKVKD